MNKILVLCALICVSLSPFKAVGSIPGILFGLPAPSEFVKVDYNVPVLMSDGVRLFCDVYRPSREGKFPVILTRTPYGKQNPEHHYGYIANLFAEQGFVVVMQNVRGKSPSEGEFYPHVKDAEDGAATIAWAREQSWCDGQVALFGFSYLGVTAWHAAIGSNHPVATVIPWFTSSSPYRLWYDHGSAYLRQVLYWVSKYEGAGENEVSHDDLTRVLGQSTDWKEMDVLLNGRVIQGYRDCLEHQQEDAFWQQLAPPLASLKQDVPVLFGSGWYDQFLRATIADFKALRESPGSKRKESRLVLGPWLHNPMHEITVLNLPATASFMKQLAVIMHWVKKWTGKEETFEMAPVTYFIMGENKWCTANDWPPPESTAATYYLDAKAQSLAELPGMQAVNTIVFDPLKFVPSKGGRMLYSNDEEGPTDQTHLKNRSDVLLWSSAALTAPLSIVGAPKATLYLSHLPSNFDLSCKLIDVFPDGKMQLITDGYFRVAHHGKKPLLCVEVQFADTAYSLPAGHRLQMALTHSDFPAHEPNSYMIKMPQVTFSVLTGSSYPSSLSFSKL